MTFSILEVVFLLIVSNLGSYALGRYRAKQNPLDVAMFLRLWKTYQVNVRYLCVDTVEI